MSENQAPQPQQSAPAVDVLRIALGALECTAADQETYFKDSRGDNIGTAIDAVTKALTTPPQGAPAPQPVGLTDEHVFRLVNSLYSPDTSPADWCEQAVRAAIAEFCRINGIKPPVQPIEGEQS